MVIRSVLVVDDHASFRKRLARAFEFLGYEVTVAAGFADGETYEVAASVDLVVLDYRLAADEPWGIEITRELIERVPGTLVVIISSYCDTSMVADAKDAGAIDVVDKVTEGLAAKIMEGVQQRLANLLEPRRANLRRLKKHHTCLVIRAVDGNKSKAARILGHSRRSLQKMSKKIRRLDRPR